MIYCQHSAELLSNGTFTPHLPFGKAFARGSLTGKERAVIAKPSIQF